MKQAELKSCPFCGLEAEVREFTHIFIDAPDLVAWGIGCTGDNCWAAIDGDMAWYKTKEEAIEAWNKRV